MRSPVLVILFAAFCFGGCEEALPKTERMQEEPLHRAGSTGEGPLYRPLDPTGQPTSGAPGH